MVIHNRVKCGLHLKLNNLLSINSPPTIHMAANSLRTFNNPHNIRLLNFDIPEAIHKCNLPCSIQVCEGWVKVILLQDRVCIQAKVPNSTCKLQQLALSPVLKVGRHSNRLSRGNLGAAGQDNSNDYDYECLSNDHVL